MATQRFNKVTTLRGGLRIGSGSANYAQFDTKGHLTLAGSARVWRDELSDALSLKVQGTGMAANPTEGGVDFQANAGYTQDYLYTNVQLNHDRDSTAVVQPHIHWVQSSGSTPNFLLQYRWQRNGKPKVTDWTPLACNVNAFTYTSGSLMQISDCAEITAPSDSGLSDIIQFRISRDINNGTGVFSGSDLSAQTVLVTNFDLHFMVNSLGSDEEYVK